jgi:16S rRNA U1498 N3-methylase RsmE
MQDAPSMMLSLEEIKGDDVHYIYLRLELGEEVKTFRDDGTETFAITYQATDFVESYPDELKEIVLESVDYLLAKFTEQLEEDKE